MAPFGFTPKARHNRGVALRSTYRLDGWVMGPVDKEGWGLSYVFAQPSVLAAAATDLAGIGSAINQATAAVAAPTTGLAAAAADEVSTALATLFGAYGQQFQAISAQVAAFHNEFTQRLAAAANAFVNAEATNTSALVQEATAGLFKPTSPPVLPPMFNQNTAIIMGGTGSPIPTPSYVNAITTLFIDPVVSNPVVKALVTPELYPITGVKSLPFKPRCSWAYRFSTARFGSKSTPETTSPCSAIRRAPSSRPWKCSTSSRWVPTLPAPASSISS